MCCAAACSYPARPPHRGVVDCVMGVWTFCSATCPGINQRVNPALDRVDMTGVLAGVGGPDWIVRYSSASAGRGT